MAEDLTPTFWSAPELAKAGFPVFPITPGEKKPSLEGGFYGASRDLSEIAKWIEEGRENHNIALPTGIAYDSCLVVVEADSEKAYAWMEQRYGPPTVESAHKHKAGGHWWFRHPRDGKIASRKVENIEVDLDRKGDGGYVLAPPSTGKTWANGIPQKADLLPLPLELRGPKKGATAPVIESSNGRLNDEARQRAVNIIAEHVRTIAPGKRHEHLMHLCGVLLSRNIPAAAAESILIDGWEAAGGDLAERARDEVPNTLATTQVAIAEERASGVPQMEAITPGLFEELEKAFRWRLGSVSPNGRSNSGDIEDSGDGIQKISAQEWTPPAVFHSVYLPEFPRDIFPPWMTAYTEALAEATQTPRDLVGMLGLTAGAVAASKLVDVEVWDGWREPTNLFTATALRSGSRKSTVFERMCAPIEEHEAFLIEETAEEVAEQQARRCIYEGRLKKAEQQASKADGDQLDKLTADALQIAADLESITVLTEPRLLVDDTSPERLASILAEQGGRLALMSAEGGIFDIMAGRYSQGIPNLDVYLKGHAGDALRVDRVGRKADFVRKPALTCGLAIQPDVLQGLANRPGFRGRGLLGRFLYAMPRDTLGTRGIRTAAVDRDLETTYGRKIKYILGLSPKLPTEDHKPHIFRLDAGAQDEMERFMVWIEPQLAEGAELGDMTDWAGKLAGAVVRIAGILHMLDHAGKRAPWDHAIDKDVVRRAIEVGHYLLAHAKYVMAWMGSDPVVEDAKYILRWIERKGCEGFTKREAWQDTKGRFDTVSDLESGLNVLMEHGYIREDPNQPPHHGPGRKPSPRYETNPLFKTECHPQNPHNPHNRPLASPDPHNPHNRPLHSPERQKLRSGEQHAVEDLVAKGVDPAEAREIVLSAREGF
jgi:replicative DNA helicase